MPLPRWERLSEALQRVMGTVVTEKKAKRDLCDAIADLKIRLRICFMWRPTSQDFLTRRNQPTSKVYYVKKDEIPRILNLGDFDWRRSRIRKPGLWLKIRDPSGSFFANWQLIETARYTSGDPIPYSQRGGRSLAYEHRIELRRADVTKVLCGGEDIHHEQAHTVPQSKAGAGAKTQGIKEAIGRLWPDGIPKTLLAKERDDMIRKYFPDPNHAPTVRQIQRVLKDLGSR